MLSSIYAWLLLNFPWISDLIPWFELAKASWDTMESLALIGALFWVGHRLKRERIKISGLIDDLGEKVDTSGQIANAAREAAETAMSRPAGPVQAQNGSTANWEIIRSDWQTTRDRLELAIKRIRHKATRAKYGNINRHSYADVINQLREDEQLKSDKAWMALLNMNQRFLSLRTRTGGVGPREVEEFKALLRDVNGSLPKLPHPPAPVAQAGQILQAAE
jgi:hypothetical protein